jgi:hypothetical protein
MDVEGGKEGNILAATVQSLISVRVCVRSNSMPSPVANMVKIVMAPGKTTL